MEEMKNERDRIEREEEQEAEIRRLEQMEYVQRETNRGKPPVSGIIPQAQSPPQPSSPMNRDASPKQRNIFEAAGVVMSTDSEESEIEANDKRKVVPMQQFKWTPENEELLE